MFKGRGPPGLGSGRAHHREGRKNMNISIILKKGAAALAACVILFTLFAAPCSALAVNTGQTKVRTEQPISGDEPLGIRSVVESHDPPPTDTDFSFIRVLITTGGTSTLWLDLYGQYVLNGSIPLSGTSGAPYQIEIKKYNSTNVLITNRETNEVLAYGAAPVITRVNQLYEAGYAKLTKSGSSKTLNRMYLGDFTFRVTSGVLNMINTVSMAYYLYGVVGYEMAPGCEDEALKAQAIAAKTFALYYVDVSPSSTWDVQDGYTSSQYQGYRGFKENRLATMPHCLAVVGLALSYEGTFVPTCYAHSDGGETALPSHVFGSSRFDDAYSVSIDDIEFDNDDDTVRKIKVTFGGTGDSSRFRDFILTKINALYGVNATKVRSITELYTFNPVEGTQRNMRKLHVRAVVKTSSGDATYTFECPTEHLKTYAISDVDGSGDSYSSSSHVFSENYLIFWGREKENGYELYFARYGHGLGLSQIGANTRANSVYGQSCEEILAFYYPKFDLIQINELNPDGTGGQIVTPPEAAAYGVCTANNTNVRSGPSTDYNIVGHLQENEHIDIFDAEDGWYKIIKDGVTGWVSMTYSRLTMFPSPANGVFTLRDGIITATRGNLRSEPYVNSRNLITRLPNGTTFTAWASVGEWFYVVTPDGLQGFLHRDVMQLSDPYPFTGSSSLVVRDKPYSGPSMPALMPEPPYDPGAKESRG